MLHKRSLIVVLGLAVFLFLQGTTAIATQLVWRPINPSFGGSPYNSTWLLASAQAQNKLKEPYDSTRWYKDPMESFQENLNRQILYKLSRNIIEGAFGEEGLEPGQYIIGDYTIDVAANLDGIAVVITNSATGDTVEVEVPYY